MSKPFYKNTNFIILFVISTLLVLRFTFPKEVDKEVENKQVSQEEKGLRHVRMESFNSEIFDFEIKIFAETKPYKYTELTSKYKGDISEIFVKEGDIVEKNQKIIKIQDNGLEDSLNSANLALQEAQLNLEASKNLKNKGLISQLEFINKQTEYKRALSNQQTANKAFEDSFITANFSGVIDNFDWNIGDTVKENQIIATLSDTSKIKSLIKIPENYISDISLSNNVYFKFPEYNLPAKFSHISKVGNLDTHTFNARVISENKDSLNSGLSVPVYVSIGVLVLYH